MFAQKHPILFFLLMTLTISGILLVLILAITAWMMAGQDDLTPFETSRPKIGVIEVTGMIRDSRDILNAFRKFREDDQIRGIVLRVDSPGGGAGASQEIMREARKTQAIKPVVASLGPVAASGGYYVAIGAQGIMANPGTVTGSIGVIMMFTDIQQLMEKIGLAPVVIKSGQYKDIGSPMREMTVAERQILESLAGEIHQQFKSAVAEYRNLPQAAVDQLADGRVFTGERALAAGLVDRLGNLEDALQWAGELAGVEGPVTPVRVEEPKWPWMKYLSEAALAQVRLTVESLLTRPGVWIQ